MKFLLLVFGLLVLKAAANDVGELCVVTVNCDAQANLVCPPILYGCDASRCECAPGFTTVGTSTQCREIKNIDESCNSATDFCVGDSECTANTCQCPNGQQVYTGVEGQCLPTGLSPIGGDCTQDSNCLANRILADSGTCTASNVCQCATGYTQQGESCVPFSRFEVCDTDGPCEVGFICRNQVCECENEDDEYYSHIEQCVHPQANIERTVREACDTDQNFCKPDLVCQVCPRFDDGTAPPGTICLGNIAQAALGEACTTSTDCTGGPNIHCGLREGCPFGTCVCDQGFSSGPAGSCLRVREFGQSCSSATDTCADETTCQNGVCDCQEGQRYTDGYCRGPELLRLGEAGCGNDNDCLALAVGILENANCNTNTGVCECDEGYPDVGESQCIPFGPNENCGANGVCTAGFACTNQVCVCPTGQIYHEPAGQCVDEGATRTQNLNEVCTQESTNSADDQFCTQGFACVTCGLSPDFECLGPIDDDSSSTANTGLGDFCTSSDDCVAQENLVCSQREGCGIGVCTCGDNFSPDGRSCTRVRNFGETCDPINELCASNLICTANECHCETGFEYEQDLGICVDESLIRLGQNGCITAGNCLAQSFFTFPGITNVECDADGVCQCVEGFQAVGQQCLFFAPDSSCGSNGRCNPGFECVDSMCVCENPSTVYHAPAGRCVHVDAGRSQGLNERCTGPGDVTGNRNSELFCGEGLICDSCLDNPGVFVCLGEDTGDGDTDGAVNYGLPAVLLAVTLTAALTLKV